MRRTSAWVFVCALLAGAAAPGGWVGPRPALADAETLTGKAVVLAAPDPSAAALGIFDPGTVVSVDGPPQGAYYPVSVDGLSGWVPGALLSVPQDAPASGPVSTSSAGGASGEGSAPRPAPKGRDGKKGNRDADAGTPAPDESAAQDAPGDQSAKAEPPTPTEPPVATDAPAPTDAPAATEAPSQSAPNTPVAVAATEAPSGDASPAATEAAELDAAPATEAPPADAPTADAGSADPSNSAVAATEAPAAQATAETTPPADATGATTPAATAASTADPGATGVAATEAAPTAVSAATPAPTDAAAGTAAPTSAPLPTPEPTPSLDLDGDASVTTDVDLRSDPNDASGTVFRVPSGSTVHLTGQAQNGYVSAEFMWMYGWLPRWSVVPAPPVAAESATATPDPSLDLKTPKPGSGYAFTTVDLAMRAGPSANDDEVTTIPAGSKVNLTGVWQNDFQRVTYGDQVGWVSNDFLRTPTDPTPETKPNGKPEYSQQQVVKIIYAAADRYGQSRDDMLRVAKCESNLDPYAVNPSGSYGLFQFIRSTWQSTPYGNQDIFDPKANANAAGWMWQQGRKTEWVCK
jgi:uncharacterized protein YraI